MKPGDRTDVQVMALSKSRRIARNVSQPGMLTAPRCMLETTTRSILFAPPERGTGWFRRAFRRIFRSSSR